MTPKNASAWESEYRNSQFLTQGIEPLGVVKDFLKWLRRKQKIDMTDFTVLDLGCGNGKNLNYTVSEFAKSGIGYDISKTAIADAVRLKESPTLQYEIRSIDKKFPLDADAIDLVFDVTASNSLDEAGRAIFLSEVVRVLKSGHFFFVRALCKDGDDNAKKLIKEFPGPEYDTYVLPGVGITERVFSRDDFVNLYAPFFEIVFLEKTMGYQKWGNQSYKRNYWIAYLKRK
jgi:SAM-dependent methyltransferase